MTNNPGVNIASINLIRSRQMQWNDKRSLPGSDLLLGEKLIHVGELNKLLREACGVTNA